MKDLNLTGDLCPASKLTPAVDLTPAGGNNQQCDLKLDNKTGDKHAFDSDKDLVT